MLWTRKDSAANWGRIGTLTYDASDRKGLFNGTAPETSFELIMTAEENASPPSPSSEIVFSQKVN